MNEQMVIRRSEIDVAIFDDHTAFRLPHRQLGHRARDCRQDANALCRDMQDDEYRGGQVRRQAAQYLLEWRGRASRPPDHNNVPVAHGTRHRRHLH